MKKLTLGFASLALLSTLGCGSLRGEGRHDSDSDSESDRDEDSEDTGGDEDEGGVLPIDDGDDGSDDGNDDDNDDDGGDAPPPPAGGGGGGGGDDDDEDPAPAPSTCPGIPAGGRCSFEDGGFVMLETCDDGEVERTVCANDHFSAENRCVETAAGAECVSTTSVKIFEEEPAYICLGGAREYLLFLADEDIAVTIDLDTDEEAVGDWNFTGVRFEVNVPGFVNESLSFFDENAVVVRLFELEGTEECFIVGYEAQDAVDAVFDCRATGFAGSDDIVLTLDGFGGLEFFMVEDVAQGTGVEVLEETQRFGGYYVEGDRLFLGIDFTASDFHRDLAATTLRLLDDGSIDIEPIGSFTACELR